MCPAIAERKRIIELRFSKDNRITEVKNILDTSREDSLSGSIASDLRYLIHDNSAEDIATAQQKLITKWTNRMFAIPLGKSMFDFDSAIIVTTDAFVIPSVPISIKVPPLNVAVELAVIPQSDMLDWPEFHLGASAGIQIRQDCPGIDSSWIVFNQIKDKEGKSSVDAKHGITKILTIAGFLFGIGLLGHLKYMASSDQLRYYLLPQYEMISVGLLLGLGVSFLATRSGRITQMVAVHVPSMLPANSSSLNTASITRTAAIVSYGLLHFGSNSRNEIEKILFDFEKAKYSESEVENSNTQSYLVGCGFSLVWQIPYLGLYCSRKELQIRTDAPYSPLKIYKTGNHVDCSFGCLNCHRTCWDENWKSGNCL